MTVGRAQLAVTGLQDIFLTEKPDITYFQKQFRRHTKFALEVLDNSFFNKDIKFGDTIRTTIERRGDLIRNIYLRIELSELVDAGTSGLGYTDSIGNAIIEYADLIIGGQTVERITGEFMEIYTDMFLPDEQQNGAKILVGKTGTRTGLGPATSNRLLFINLPFYFTHNNPLSIPLSALTYQEVEVSIKLRSLNELVVTSQPPVSVSIIEGSILNATLPVEYVFLSDEENEYLKSRNIDYVITQLQLARGVIPAGETVSRFYLDFINPVKELFFVIQNKSVVSSNVYSGNDWFNYKNPQKTSNIKDHQLDKLQFNFNEETYLDSEVADASFLYAIQPMTRHTRVPSRLIYNYSFALNPENYLPTGQVNMSRIQHKLLTIHTTPNTEERDIRIYARSYNILRIANGLAGILFIDNNFI